MIYKKFTILRSRRKAAGRKSRARSSARLRPRFAPRGPEPRRLLFLLAQGRNDENDRGCRHGKPKEREENENGKLFPEILQNPAHNRSAFPDARLFVLVAVRHFVEDVEEFVEDLVQEDVVFDRQITLAVRVFDDL